MTFVLSIIAALLGPLAVLGVLAQIKKQVAGSGVSETAKIQEEIARVTETMEQLLLSADDVATKAQLENVIGQAQGLTGELEQQKGMLKQIEEKLEKVQKEVEGKESEQQEAKSSREEDEAKLQELLAAYGDISSESMTLEQQLAASLKNLDTLMNEAHITDDQKIILSELSKTLTNAGARMRDLITDYKAVYERLEGLKLQHTDLENEYTKLVEQQLGA